MADKKLDTIWDMLLSPAMFHRQSLTSFDGATA